MASRGWADKWRMGILSLAAKGQRDDDAQVLCSTGKNVIETAVQEEQTTNQACNFCNTTNTTPINNHKTPKHAHQNIKQLRWRIHPGSASGPLLLKGLRITCVQSGAGSSDITVWRMYGWWMNDPDLKNAFRLSSLCISFDLVFLHRYHSCCINTLHKRF